MRARRRVNRRIDRTPPRYDVREAVTLVRQSGPKLAVLGVIALIALAAMRVHDWATHPRTLPFKSVSVRGELARVDTDRLRKVLAENVTGGFFSQDLRTLQQRIEELPWVHRASLRRAWPSRLFVYIEEQQPIARWGENGLLNRHGEVFRVSAAEMPDNLPTITGTPGREHDLIQDFIKIDALLHGLGLNLVELHEDARLDQRLVLRGGVTLELGRRNRAQRLQRFAEVYGTTLAPFIGRIGSLDLRYANGFAVSWRQEARDDGKPDGKTEVKAHETRAPSHV